MVHGDHGAPAVYSFVFMFTRGVFYIRFYSILMFFFLSVEIVAGCMTLCHGLRSRQVVGIAVICILYRYWLKMLSNAISVLTAITHVVFCFFSN